MSPEKEPKRPTKPVAEPTPNLFACYTLDQLRRILAKAEELRARGAEPTSS